jgi:NADPH-dependent ferric siderophore reductase
MSDLSGQTRPEAPAPTFERPRRPPMPIWRLEVIDRAPVTPRMLRVRFAGAELETWRPGQDLVLSLPQPGGEPARRHYTIRNYDAEEGRIDIDFVLHGDSPATRWAKQAELGQQIDVQGPRGRTSIAPDAGEHLFCGDETCIPGIFAMAEALPAGAKARALIEVGREDDRQALQTKAEVEVEWLVRGRGPGPSSILLDRLTQLAPSPSGRHAYVIGETSNVRAQRHYLLEQGFDRSQITAEGYWRPGRVGGHDHV